VLVQRRALSILPRHRTDNISNNLYGGYKINDFVFVTNANCSHINIYSYPYLVTWHASVPPLGTAAQIMRTVISS
jgi:hypothetical protein